jgi:hypothetical protein
VVSASSVEAGSFDSELDSNTCWTGRSLASGKGFAGFHVGALAFGTPVIFVYAVAQEDYAETLGEPGGGDVG